MIITIDNKPMAITPNSLNWTPPQPVDHDGDSAPVRGRYWTCTLALPETTVQVIGDWYDLFDSDQHTAILPHPRTGVLTSFTCYANITGIRQDTVGDCAYVSGLDVELTGIVI